MKFLVSIINLMKAGNMVLVSLAILTGITALVIITFFDVTEKAIAQEPSGAQSHETVASGDTSQSKSSAFGLGLLAAAISTSVSAIAAGVAVAIVGSAAMGAVAERPEVMGRSIIFVGLAEGIAIYGLIISIMILGKL